MLPRSKLLVPGLILCGLVISGLFLASALAQPPAQPPAPLNWSADTKPLPQPALQLHSVLVAPTAISATAADSTAAPKATASFKKTLNEAASQAFKEGQISRWELARIRLAIACRPQAVAEIQACAVDEAVSAGKMKPADAIAAAFDWTVLLEFIKQLLPIILQFISIFG